MSSADRAPNPVPEARPTPDPAAGPGPSIQGSPTGRLRAEGLSGSERNWATWCHLSPLLAFLVIGPLAGIVPLVMWLARRDTSSFTDDHGREVVNMCITGALLFVIGLVTGIGMVAWLVWLVFAVVGVIRGATAATNSEFFRYPMTIRFIGEV